MQISRRKHALGSLKNSGQPRTTLGCSPQPQPRNSSARKSVDRNSSGQRSRASKCGEHPRVALGLPVECCIHKWPLPGEQLVNKTWRIKSFWKDISRVGGLHCRLHYRGHHLLGSFCWRKGCFVEFLSAFGRLGSLWFLTEVILLRF